MAAFRMSLLHCALLSVVAHAALLLYGELHDRTSTVKFTDVDYFVFTDAADLVANGGSPYDRTTYRYSPLLAWMLLPGATVLPRLFGKVLFCAVDVVLGCLIHTILRRQKVTEVSAIYCACAWLFNPMALVVSARGNAESVVAALVLGCLLLVLRRRSRLAGLVLGLAVHLKIYPIIYAAPLYFALESGREPIGLFRRLVHLLYPTRTRLNFLLYSFLGFAVPTILSFLAYGWRYLDMALLHHARRHDIRHNFSPYFYLLYLTADQPERWVSLAAFIPQGALVVALALRYRRLVDLPFCLLLQTIVFVTFNKVCTSQYFLWYLSLFPLVLPRLRFEWTRLVFATTLWVAAQAVWLFAAYALEFEGRNTFLHLWVAGLLFFGSNVYVIDFLLGAYRPSDYAKKLS